MLSVGERFCAAPEERGGPVAGGWCGHVHAGHAGGVVVRADGAVVHDGCGLALLVFVGVEGFGAGDVGDGVLAGPVGRGGEGDARGVAVDGEAVGGGLEAPALLGGFGAVEAGLFEAEPAPGEAAGEDVEGDVGGVLLMVAESGDGVFGGGEAVRVGGGADGGVADGCGVEAEEGALAEADVVEGGDLHEEVVRVLAVDDGLAEGGLALLEELGVLAVGDGGGFEREHGAEGELAVSPLGRVGAWPWA